MSTAPHDPDPVGRFLTGAAYAETVAVKCRRAIQVDALA